MSTPAPADGRQLSPTVLAPAQAGTAAKPANKAATPQFFHFMMSIPISLISID